MDQHPEAGGVAIVTRRSYAIVIEWAETNYSAYVPDVPGCVTTGATVEEAIANMREALQAHLEVTCEYGEPIPEVLAHVATVDVTIGEGGAAHTTPEGSATRALSS
jgi:predicted RNase H-like HicB family nuclease